MSTLPADLEALMPEPAGYRTRYRSEPEMIGHYPWTYADAERRRRKYDRPECEYEDLFTADQMREAILGATERAAKLCDDIADGAAFVGDTRAEKSSEGCAAAIRARTGGGQASKEVHHGS